MSAELNYIQLESITLIPDVASFVNYSQDGNNFIEKACDIQPMPQADSDITAATTWTTSTVLTFAQLEAEALASPAPGAFGHIELVYNLGLDQIQKIEINITDDLIKTIYSFSIN